jgi:hypothetical protein
MMADVGMVLLTTPFKTFLVFVVVSFGRTVMAGAAAGDDVGCRRQRCDS